MGTLARYLNARVRGDTQQDRTEGEKGQGKMWMWMCLSPYAKKRFTQLSQDNRPPPELSDISGLSGLEEAKHAENLLRLPKV